ncbi:hypothetical protein GUITHDRAFT_144674 [Guillardia theta CCMP2712]|uniref:Uncharacterized protein n=1 Tax=Guillardia theta (strain CCMP2712) TaxID=905079 RepID=L1INJ2_GUITC|nr:hypothetical protein GUITHDRAFT_144674 [Guillardia theta CCMP2712]EKX37846.1 hypothetical protein GUITHDRAFT_144674 [Guillardia theta CCMP2712]|eukprot:XP_005824826.1 hypothetical protein GUITHDRAFT_144674 [Guillardia theta CCMP2712]
MRDASPTMRVVEDVALMGLTNSLVLLYRRADAVYLVYMVEYYDELPCMTVFIHDHVFGSWHSQLRPMFKRARAFYLLMAARLRDGKSGALVHPELQTFPSYSTLAGFTDNAVTLNSCYCHEHREPLCWGGYNLNDYERETNRSLHNMTGQDSLDRIYQAVISLPERWKSRRGRWLVWEEPHQVFQQSERLFGSLHARLGRAKSWRSIPFASCCAMFIAQRKHIRRQPKQLYKESLSALLSTHLLPHHTGRWFEFNWDNLLFDPSGSLDASRRRLYVDIDDVYAQVFNETNAVADLQELIDS